MKSVLAECAWAASRTKTTYLATRYWKLAGRRGAKKALIATAHRMLIISYFILLRKEPYYELVSNLDERAKQRKVTKLVRQLKELGIDTARIAITAN